jgi:hypothetical protein
MGHEVQAKCLDCGETFSVAHGGGFSFHLVRCDKCGESKSIRFDDLGELHTRYMKGLSGPFSIATAKHDEDIQKHAPVEPISEAEYLQGIEAIAGKCRCRGKYTLNAPPRCPKCHSTRIEEGRIDIMYD